MNGYLPFISIVLLLLIGVITLLKSAIGQPQSILLKSMLTLVIALVPFAVHMAMYQLTYSAGPIPTPKMLGALSIAEWLILLLGFVLAGVGFSLFLRAKNP